MNRFAKLAVGAFALVSLSGCYYYPDGYYDRYGYNDRYGYSDRYGYNGSWYDGYYGPYYGGYWGPEGDFYYYDSGHRYHRDSDHHFRHARFEGAREYRADRDARVYDRDYDRDDRRY